MRRVINAHGIRHRRQRKASNLQTQICEGGGRGSLVFGLSFCEPLSEDLPTETCALCRSIKEAPKVTHLVQNHMHQHALDFEEGLELIMPPFNDGWGFR